jgi:hypothetical protein
MTLGGFYFSNYIMNNFLLDTIYNSTAFSFNIIRYGVTSTYNNKGLSVNMDVGKMNQVGVAGSSLTRYNYVDTRFSYSTPKKFRVSLNALRGLGREDRDDKNSRMLEILNLGGTLSYRFIGFSAFYLQDPRIDLDTNAKPYFFGYQKSMYFTPSLTFMVFRRLSMNWGYTVSRSIHDNRNTGFISSQLIYSHPRRGWEINLYGTVPVKESKATGFGLNTRFINLSLVKKLNMPLPLKRKYYDLKVLVYLDENDNQVYEPNEPIVPELQINIGDVSFVTNNMGYILYKNIEKGEYSVDLSEAEHLRGWVPPHGLLQKVILSGSKTFYIGYKRSRLISGVISIFAEGSNTPHYTDRIKVIAVDSSGQYYSTLCNEKGEYFMNVPANEYTVSLNPDAYGDRMQPDKFSYKIDLVNHQRQNVNFIIREQKRKIRLLQDK